DRKFSAGRRRGFARHSIVPRPISTAKFRRPPHTSPCPRHQAKPHLGALTFRCHRHRRLLPVPSPSPQESLRAALLRFPALPRARSHFRVGARCRATHTHTVPVSTTHSPAQCSSPLPPRIS